MRLRAAVAAAAAGALLLPAGAGAHSIVRINNGVVSYISSDAISLNKLEISNEGANVRFFDPTVDGGIDQGTCSPRAVNDEGEPIEVLCPRAGLNQIRVEIGEREDTMRSTSDIRSLTVGGNGKDELLAGNPDDIVVGNEGDDLMDAGGGNDQANGNEGNDTLRGNAGNDVLQAGPGSDTVDGGPGNDEIRVRDGVKDAVGCGEGADKVDADTIDDVAADCESVARAAAPPPSGDPGAGGGAGDPSGGTGAPGGSGGTGGDGGPGAAADTAAPTLRVGGSTLQKLRGSRKVTVLATSSERGTVAASGFLDVAGIRLPLKSKASSVRTAGGGAEITVRLSPGQYRRARRALRKRRKVTILLGVVATDAAGNSTAKRAPRIRLRR